MKRFAMLAVVLLIGCGGPPDLGKDEQALKAAEGLFTATTAKDPKLLAKATARLDAAHRAGKLSAAAHKHLTELAATAKAGDWETAAHGVHAVLQKAGE